MILKKLLQKNLKMSNLKFFIISENKNTDSVALKYANILRNNNYCTICGFSYKSIKSNMKYAHKKKSDYVILIFNNEIILKNMKLSNQEKITFDKLIKKFDLHYKIE